MDKIRMFIGVIFLINVETVFGDRLICEKPIDNESRIGFPSGLVVTLTEDYENMACRFSVEGVAAGSPPQEEVFNALSILRNDSSEVFSAMKEGALATSLPVLLAAASPVHDSDPDLQSEEFRLGIESCFMMAFEGDYDEFAHGENWGVDLEHLGFSCALISDGSDEALNQLNDFLEGSLRVEVIEGRKLVFKNRRDGLIEYLFLPF